MPTASSSSRLHSASPLGYQATNIMTWYSTQSHCPDTERTSPCPILIIMSVWLGSGKYQFLSHWIDSTSVQNQGLESFNLLKLEMDDQLMWSSCEALLSFLWSYHPPHHRFPFFSFPKLLSLLIYKSCLLVLSIVIATHSGFPWERSGVRIPVDHSSSSNPLQN